MKSSTTCIPQYIIDYFNLPYTKRSLKYSETLDITDGLKIIKETNEQGVNMATRGELIDRGEKLAKRYDEVELKEALRNAIAIDDNEERLSLQWALKKVTSKDDGYAFTKKAKGKLETKLDAGEK